MHANGAAQYGAWEGLPTANEQISLLAKGIDDRGVLSKCNAVLSGYLGSEEQGGHVIDVVKRVKAANPAALYVCDPVMGHPAKADASFRRRDRTITPSPLPIGVISSRFKPPVLSPAEKRISCGRTSARTLKPPPTMGCATRCAPAAVSRHSPLGPQRCRRLESAARAVLRRRRAAPNRASRPATVTERFMHGYRQPVIGYRLRICRSQHVATRRVRRRRGRCPASALGARGAAYARRAAGDRRLRRAASSSAARPTPRTRRARRRSTGRTTAGRSRPALQAAAAAGLGARRRPDAAAAAAPPRGGCGMASSFRRRRARRLRGAPRRRPPHGAALRRPEPPFQSAAATCCVCRRHRRDGLAAPPPPR